MREVLNVFFNEIATKAQEGKFKTIPAAEKKDVEVIIDEISKDGNIKMGFNQPLIPPFTQSTTNPAG